MNREKTTATLLIAIFMISTIAFAVPIISAAPGVVTNLVTYETFTTIQLAIDDTDTLDGHTLLVGAGSWYGALVTKSVEIRGEGGAVIDDGPIHHPSYTWKNGFKLKAGSDGTTISHFAFEVELPIYGSGIDGVTVEHNKFYDVMQAITNWDGDGWVIRLNVIEGIGPLDNSGGCGIVVGSRFSEVSGNIVKHNTVVADIENPYTFSVGGILLCSDERWSFTGGEVTNNKIVHNKVKITGERSWAISLEVIDDPIPSDVYAKRRLFGNIVGFNDFRGSISPIDYYPVPLDDVNTVSRNLGANRGQGEVPASMFSPN